MSFDGHYKGQNYKNVIQSSASSFRLAGGEFGLWLISSGTCKNSFLQIATTQRVFEAALNGFTTAAGVVDHNGVNIEQELGCPTCARKPPLADVVFVAIASLVSQPRLNLRETVAVERCTSRRHFVHCEVMEISPRVRLMAKTSKRHPTKVTPRIKSANSSPAESGLSVDEI